MFATHLAAVPHQIGVVDTTRWNGQLIVLCVGVQYFRSRIEGSHSGWMIITGNHYFLLLVFFFIFAVWEYDGVWCTIIIAPGQHVTLHTGQIFILAQ